MKTTVHIRNIKCPVCGSGRLLSASKQADLRVLHLYPPDKNENADWFVKCPVCRQQIGMAMKR